MSTELDKPEDGFSDEGFWAKLKAAARVAGREVVYAALCLYYAAQRPETPHWAKMVIFGALAYFVLPTDAIPDFLPGVGYGDDLGALVAATTTVARFVDADVKRLAQERVQEWFGA
jgi:uncharacterized membrane protein YkvA (DUF1232 family)